MMRLAIIAALAVAGCDVAAAGELRPTKLSRDEAQREIREGEELCAQMEAKCGGPIFATDGGVLPKKDPNWRPSAERKAPTKPPHCLGLTDPRSCDLDGTRVN